MVPAITPEHTLLCNYYIILQKKPKKTLHLLTNLCPQFFLSHWYYVIPYCRQLRHTYDFTSGAFSKWRCGYHHLPAKLIEWLCSFCTHLSLTGVHAWWQLLGELVHQEFWFEIHSGAVGLGKWHGKLGSLGRWTGGTRGFGGQVASVASAERYGTTGGDWSTTVTHFIEAGVVQILKTKADFYLIFGKKQVSPGVYRLVLIRG